MPGITIGYGFVSYDTATAAQLPNRLLPLHCEKLSLLPDLHAMVLLTPDYPFEQMQDERYVFVFEGIAYGAPSLQTLFNLFTSPEGIQTNAIRNFVRSADGEFLLLLCDRISGQLVLATDRFGRLPLYFTTSGNAWLISRNIQHMLDLKGNISLDEQALAQLLLFGYPLSKRSLYKNIHRLPPSTIFECSVKTEEFRYWSDFQIPEGDEQKPVNAEELLEILHLALQQRIVRHPNATVSLSGGLDSRLLLGLLAKHNYRLPLLTYDDKDGSAAADIMAVKQMLQQSNLYDLHDFISLKTPTKADVSLLMQIKAGLNTADMAFLIPFLQYLQQKKLVQITGDGGDKVLAGLVPTIRLQSEEKLIRYLLFMHKSPSVALVAGICGLHPDDIMNCISASLKEYSHSDPHITYRNFMLRERAMQWLFEGEDRNRHFGWSTTPYYHPALFDSGMQIPEKNKAWAKLFVQLLAMLPGNLQNITNPNWKAAPTDRAAISSMLLKQRIRWHLPNWFPIAVKAVPLIDQASFRWNDYLNAYLPDDIKERVPAKLPEIVWYRLMSCRNQHSA